MRVKFEDVPLGGRFHYYDLVDAPKRVFVKVQHRGPTGGVVIEYAGKVGYHHQSMCRHDATVDAYVDFID